MRRTLPTRLLRILAVTLMAMLALSACGDEPEDRLPTETALVGQALTAVNTPAVAFALTSTPTFRPTEQAPTPSQLDREFADTPELQQRRARLFQTYIEPMVQDEAVREAMVSVPRHAFVPTQHLSQAYNDHPLPIGYGQTISQPSLVAIMTEMLELEPGDTVLEIGTGSGYQAAILREIVDTVYTIEIVPELAGIARAVFDKLGYEDIHTLRADGYCGWWEHAPFDAIIVTAAPDHLPAPLVAQLDPDGGRLVIPIGPPGGYQSLWLVVRHGDEVEMERVFDVAFVPLTREGD